MRRITRGIALVMLLALVSGCAHLTPRQRMARAMIAVGAIVTIAGGLSAAGCNGRSHAPGGVCSGPSNANVAGGAAAMGVGAALIGSGLLLRPKDTPSLYSPPPPLGPVGPEPD